MAERVEAEVLINGVDISNDLIRKALEGESWDEFLMYSYRILFPHYERKEVLRFQDQVNKIRYARDKLASNLVGSRALDPRKVPMHQQEFSFDELEDPVVMGQ